MNKKESNFSLIVRGCKLLFKICPTFMKWSIVNSIINTLIPYFPIYMSALIINELSTTKDIGKLFVLIIITIFGFLILSIIRKLINIQYSLHNNYAYHSIAFYMLDYQNRMKFTYSEDTEVENLRIRIYNYYNATGAGINRLMYAIPVLVTSVVNIITSLALTLSLFIASNNNSYSGILGFINKPYSFIIIVTVMIITMTISLISTLNAQKKINDAYKQLEKCNTMLHNVMDVYGYSSYVNGMNEVITDIEISVFRRDSFIKEVNKISIKNDILCKFLDTLLTMVVMFYIAGKIYTKSIMVGDFMLYVATITKLVTGISNLINLVGSLVYNNQFLKLLFDYFDLPDDRYLGTLPIEKRSDNEYEIEFKNVSFKYPKTDFWALKNVSFKFKIGERLAIVGMNGSGKTTLIKLLSRLYEPTEGVITLNGIDIKKYDYDEYQSIFSVVFQDFKVFAFSISDNVSCSLNGDKDKVVSCLEKAGFREKLEELPKGIETIISKLYDNDGIEMSMGEKQKIAIARALYKDAPFVVLDEPTASLDPISEQEVYNRFNEMVKDKTAIYISHRLSSCRFCDKIAVLHEGKLVQVGNHEELVKDENSKYFELWNAQAQYYN